jgi:hypothetical protein
MPLYLYSNAGQCVCLLLAALSELGGSNRKQGVIHEISVQRWFAIQKGDNQPYQTQREPRWHTLIAWARKHSAMREWVTDHERDSWGLSREGHRLWPRLSEKFKSGELKVRPCYLWSQKFKLKMFPDYQPSDLDKVRPEFIYRDFEAQRIEELLKDLDIS